MNANELADELEAFHVDPDGFPYMIGEAITVLRQQQKQLELHKNAHHEAVEICRQQQAEIEALKAQRMQITEDGRIRPIFQLLSENELKKLADDYVNAYGYPFPAVSYGLEIQRRILK